MGNKKKRKKTMMKSTQKFLTILVLLGLSMCLTPQATGSDIKKKLSKGYTLDVANHGTPYEFCTNSCNYFEANNMLTDILVDLSDSSCLEYCTNLVTSFSNSFFSIRYTYPNSSSFRGWESALRGDSLNCTLGCKYLARGSNLVTIWDTTEDWDCCNSTCQDIVVENLAYMMAKYF